MTGHTAKWQLPYPEPADYVSDSQATMQELAEKIDAALSAVTASDSYTVPGTLLADLTTSGTFTPPAGVTLVHVVVIGGGADGRPRWDGPFGPETGYVSGAGGTGGDVRVFRDVSVSGDVAVTVGGPNTSTSFGSLTAAGGTPSTGPGYAVTASGNPHCSIGGTGGMQTTGHPGAAESGWPGTTGPTVNGTAYAGGGGGGAGGQSSGGLPRGGAGGAGGGAAGETQSNGVGNGVPGTGGGGGGGGRGPAGGLGGSGRVMVFTEQPTMRRNVTVPNPDPMIVAALDDHGTMTGAYAVDAATRELPALGVRVVDYPTAPVDTGRTVEVLDDPDDPDGPTHPVPVLEWPTAGWTYDGTRWTPPKEVAP